MKQIEHSNERDYPDQELTRGIIGAFYYVYNRFGFGFLEAVYRRALVVELNYRGIPAAQEVLYELYHRGVPVGSYRADLIVDGRVIVETKAGLQLDPSSTAQMLNYLHCTGLKVGLVLHFGPTPSIRRLIGSAHRLEDLTSDFERVHEEESG